MMGAMGTTRRDLPQLIVPVAILLAARALGGSGPPALRLGLAWVALLVAPALILAAPARRARGAFDAIAVGAAESIALFAALSFVVHAAGGELTILLAIHPFVVVGAGIALVAWASRRGAVGERAGGPHGATPQRAESQRAEPRRAEPLRSGPNPAAPNRATRQAVLLGLLLLLVAIVRARPVDFRMDVYDHVGAAARMSERDRIFSREMGNGDEGPHHDPRKGTWSALLASVLRLSGAEPMAMWNSATVLATLVGALALARLSREVLGGAWPVGWLILLLAQEGGPHRGWFAPSAYPGALGILLYAVFLAECLAAARGRRAVPTLLAVALPLIHLMAGLLALIAGSALVVVAWVSARDAGPDGAHDGARDDVRARFASPRAFTMQLAATLAVVAALGFWRVHSAGPLTNPMQTELQGVLSLPGGLIVPEPRTFYERLGAEGLIGLLACPFLITLARRDIGIRWLLILAALLVAMASPILAPLLVPRLGYLMRRLPALVPLPLLAAALVVELARAARAATGARRIARAAAALALLVVPAARAGEAAAIAARARGAMSGATSGAAATEAAWSPSLTAIVSALPPHARVAADPITSYALYARCLARPLVLADQHAPPNDAAAPEWLRDLARILSPWTAPAERDEILDRRSVTHILINDGFAAPVATFGLPVSPENLALLRGALDADSARFAEVATSGPLRLYAVRPADTTLGGAPDDAAGATPNTAANASANASANAAVPVPPNPYLSAGARPEPAIVTGCGIAVAGARAAPERVTPNDVVWVECTLFTPADSLAIGDYYAFLAMTRVGEATAPPFAKLSRALRRVAGRPPDRAVVERALADARYPVLLWRTSETIADRFGIRVPRDAPPGRYSITMDIVRVPVFQNRTLGALLTDNDEYAAIPVGTIEVRASGAGG